MTPLVTIKLHGHLADALNNSVWKFATNSVGEAIRSVEMNSKHKLFKYLIEKDKEGAKYKLIINGKNFKEKLDTIEDIKNSSLVMKNPKLETVDIVPIIEGAGDDFFGILTIIAGVILVVVGFVVGFSGPWGAVFVLAGLALIAGGIVSLLTSPPKFQDFREIDGQVGRTSYLFNGPQNTTREGGPVPVGYGRLLIGSQVISASYVVKDIDAQGKDRFKNKTPVPPGGGGGPGLDEDYRERY